MTIYHLTHYNGATYADLGEGLLDTSLGINLLGQNYQNFGQLIANNFIWLLENQASATAPAHPVTGQLWYDSGNSVLNYFNGSTWKTCLNGKADSVSPVNPAAGDTWWDTTNSQLNVFDGGSWVTVGPPNVKGAQFSGVTPIEVFDTNGSSHYISLLKTNGGVVGVLSNSDSFSVSPTVASTVLNGITTIANGITLVPSLVMSGTISNAQSLDNWPANTYIRTTSVTSDLLGNLVVSGSLGITTGNISIVGQSISSTGNTMTLSIGSTGLTLSSNGTITSTVDPTTSSSVTTKNYVDNQIGQVTNTVESYINQVIGNISGISSNLGNSVSSISESISSLWSAVNNDPGYSGTVNHFLTLKANISSPTFTGIARSVTPTVGDSSTAIATTQFVNTAVVNERSNTQSSIQTALSALPALYATISNPTFTGNPQSVTPVSTDSSNSIATTAFVQTLINSVKIPTSGATPTLNGVIVTGDILPSVADTYNIGQASPGKRFNAIYGKTVQATYADLAEQYEADQIYGPGTVVIFGGKKEITVSTKYCDSKIAGVISTNPAYLMNAESPGLPVALTGKVPCYVLGPVKKGDVLVNSMIEGVATSLKHIGHWTPGCIIGKSLEDIPAAETRLIMISVGRF